MKNVIGWILLVWGILSIIANIIMSITGNFSGILMVNTVVYLVFIVGGWCLSHQKTKHEEEGIIILF